jgi:hypothetical protein
VYVITPPQDLLKNRILYGIERIEQAYTLIVEAGAVPVKTVQELIKELKHDIKR